MGSNYAKAAAFSCYFASLKSAGSQYGNMVHIFKTVAKHISKHNLYRYIEQWGYNGINTTQLHLVSVMSRLYIDYCQTA